MLFTTLYVVAFNLGSLLFDLINTWIPDPASGERAGRLEASIRWSASALIVSTPVFLFMSAFTSRERRAEPVTTSSEVRTRRLDEQRVEDLTWLSEGVKAFRSRQSALPASLDDLEAAGLMGASRVDPEHSTDYEYRVLDATRYELCATFSTEWRPARAGLVFWSHRAGRVCFTLDAARERREQLAGRSHVIVGCLVRLQG